MMKKTIFLFLGIYLFLGIVSSAYWVDDPNDCPVEYNSVSCTGGELQCGIDGGVAPYCYDPSLLSPPTSNDTSNSNADDGSFNGGFLINCEATDAGEPYCDNSGNFWCDYNSTVYGTLKRTTICLEDLWGTTYPGDCRTNYFQCDGGGSIDDCEIHAGDSCGSGTGTIQLNECWDASNGNCTRISDYVDCDDDDSDGNNVTCNGANGCEINPDTTSNGTNVVYDSCTTDRCTTGRYYCDGDYYDGDGCEIQDGASCTIGAVSGTYDCSAGAGSCFAEQGGTEYACTCVVDDVDIATSGTEVVWSSSTNPFLWLTQYGTSPIFNFTFRGSTNVSFHMNSSGVYWNGTSILGGSGGGNTTAEIWAVANNGTFARHSNIDGNISEVNTNILGNVTVDTDTFNTTSEIWTVVDNGTFAREANNYYNSSRLNSTTLEDQSGSLSVVQSWVETLISTLITNHESTFKHGNTTNEIFDVADNSTFLKLTGGTLSGNLTIGNNCIINQTGGAYFCHNSSHWLIKG